jgi:hypothetical protein
MSEPQDQAPDGALDVPDAVPLLPRRSVTWLLRPSWLALHLLVVVACVVMVELGRWQWSRGGELHAIRNYSYSIEWFAFALLTLVGWIKIGHDELVPDPEADVLHGSVEDAVRERALALAEDEADPELAAWNRQFAELHLKHALKEAALSERDLRRHQPDPDRKQLS